MLHQIPVRKELFAGIYTHIADTLMSHVNMEYISQYGIITATAWQYDPSVKISALLQKTFPRWNSPDCRLAYGVQSKERGPLRELKWATPLSLEYDPNSQEFFKDIHLTFGESYFLLSSHLALGLKNIAIRDDPQHAEHIRSAVLKYTPLFGVFTPLIPHNPWNRANGPGPSAKRPADTHPHGGPARGGSRAKTTRELASMSSLLESLLQQ